MITLDDYTNSELEEMGIPLPCECLDTRYEEGLFHTYLVCENCGASKAVKTWGIGGRSW